MQACTAVVSVWAIGLVHEVSLGTFSQLDVAAGKIISLALVLTTNEHGKAELLNLNQIKLNRFNPQERLKFIALTLVLATLASGTSEYDPIVSNQCISSNENGMCIQYSTAARPVYLSYTELRRSVKISEPRELHSVSRIIFNESMLFVNERNEGIDIIDNRFPSSPERIGFINIPGNTEISMRDNNLYADS